MEKKGFKSGFAAIIGRANVGKSTLLNRLIGEKVSIVSPKPQTTRNKIAGILTTEDYQIVFEDTPGIHSARTALSRYMQKSWESAFGATDVVIAVLDGKQGVTDRDLRILERFSDGKIPLIAAVNKTDIGTKEQVVPALSVLNGLPYLSEVLPISARTGENVDLLLEKAVSFLKEGQKYFDEDEYTDQSVRFMAAEIIREKILLHFDQEVPHGIGVVIDKFELDEARGLCEIYATIVCEKASHKPILLGRQGSAIRRIGEAARKDLEQLVGTRVYLNTWVKVKEDWRESDNVIRQLGYDKTQL